MTTPDPADYIEALEAQRNAALNEVVNLRAEVAALRREFERTAEIDQGKLVYSDGRR